MRSFPSEKLEKKSLISIGKSLLFGDLRIRTIAISLLVCLMFTLAGLGLCDEQQEETDPLFRIEQNGDVGYINKTGKIVVKPQFQTNSGDFSEGLAHVGLKGDDKWGYIDKTGKFVIEPQFLLWRADDFSEGLARVMVRDKSGGVKYGFIDKTGKFAIEPKFYWPSGAKAHPPGFSEGLATVCASYGSKNGWADNKCGYIDKTGQFVIEPQFQEAGDFSEGLAAVLVGDYPTGKWGYINKAGEFVLRPQFLSASGFSEGMAIVDFSEKMPTYYSEHLQPKWYIDRMGRVIISWEQLRQLYRTEYVIPSNFSEGLSVINYNEYPASSTKCGGYIDKTGKIVIKPSFDYCQDFSEGLAVVKIGEGESDKWGYIDKTGKMVIKPQFSFANDFHNGLAEVYLGDCKDKKWGYIDKMGRFVWKSDELRMVEWIVRGAVLFVFVILVLFVGLFIKKYRRSKKQTGPVVPV